MLQGACPFCLDIQSAHFPVVVLGKNLVDLVCWCVDIGHGSVVVHEINDGCDELAHIGLYIVRLVL